jgi:hypothetical protein
MKITLIQSGGITGSKMTAKINSKLTEADWEKLVDATKKATGTASKSKDAFHYTLLKDDDDATKTVINIQQIPEEHDELFTKLFENLKVEKK